MWLTLYLYWPALVYTMRNLPLHLSFGSSPLGIQICQAWFFYTRPAGDAEWRWLRRWWKQCPFGCLLSDRQSFGATEPPTLLTEKLIFSCFGFVKVTALWLEDMGSGDRCQSRCWSHLMKLLGRPTAPGWRRLQSKCCCRRPSSRSTPAGRSWLMNERSESSSLVFVFFLVFRAREI